MGSIRIEPFTRDLILREFSFEVNGVHQSKHSVEYAFEYLQFLKASSALVEERYTDRHYLDDFASYYSRSFSTPEAFCNRFHFFRGMSPKQLEATIDRCYRPREREMAERELNQSYLGFIVQRPLKQARIGRTVLVTYPTEEGRRHYAVVRPYRVNVGAIRLRVEGLAFQEQDGGAAVCASTALWSALQRVAHVSGHRTPTPSQITQVANSPYPTTHGLDLSHMATALSSLGYVADQFCPDDNPQLFRAKLTWCLDSQLPVILAITRRQTTPQGSNEVGHAVTVTGYSEPAESVEIQGAANPIKAKGAALRVLYVHDDNLGFHAHYELKDSDTLDEHGNKKVLLDRGDTSKPAPGWLKKMPDTWVVVAALVPKPAKLRLAIETLYYDVLSLSALLQREIFPGIELGFAACFASGLDYRERLLSMSLEKGDLRRFQEELRLPRHIGVVSIHAGENHLLDIITDVSEVKRHPWWPSVLGLVAPGTPKYSPSAMNLGKVAQKFGVPIIWAPETK